MPTIECECPSCSGTGVYVGMGEHDGVAVVCGKCDGTGKHHIKYTEFTGRKKKEGVTRVIETNPGICVSTKIDIGGISYEDWWNGNDFPPGSEMRDYVCPAWWFQCADYDKKPRWKECGGLLGRSFSSCKLFENKNQCWKKWDEENR